MNRKWAMRSSPYSLHGSLHDDEVDGLTPDNEANQDIVNSVLGAQTHNSIDSLEFQKLLTFLVLSNAGALISALDAASNYKNDYYSETIESQDQQKYDSVEEIQFSRLQLAVILLIIASLFTSILSKVILGSQQDKGPSYLYYHTSSMLIMILWTGIYAISFHSSESFVVDSLGYVRCANLYFFVWMSLFISLFMVLYTSPTSFATVLKQGQDRIQLWGILLFSSSILFLSSIHLVNETCNGADHIEGGEKPSTFRFFGNISRLCRLTRFGVLTGVIGTIASGYIVSKKLHHLTLQNNSRDLADSVNELKISLGFLIVSGLAAGTITSSWGPGKFFGNMYATTWLVFLLSTKLAVECFLICHNLTSISNASVGPSLIQNFQSPRMKWISLFVFCSAGLYSAIDSAVSNGTLSKFEDSDFELNKLNVAEIYTLASLAFIMIISFVAFTRLLVVSPTGSLPFLQYEGLVAGLCLVVLIANIYTINHSDASLAVDSKGEVFNINLYLFSWAAVICSFQLLSACYGLHSTDDISPKLLRRFFWFLILKVSLVILASADHVWSSMDEICGNDTNTFCARTSFALKIGKAGLIVSLSGLIANSLTWSKAKKVEMTLCFAALSLGSIGVVFITSTNGPGETIGNLFFFSWLNFGVSAALLKSSIEDKESDFNESGDNLEMIDPSGTLS